ncbi:unnamed protein product [Cuscuta campestris]|uniref:Uncharacterized protein n=1 Tax=Cuscuta campestris TaxID=132261 RepID=A0A484MDD1_9ASTE|nr:unnamed protein product [Cuscuta campestris]
MVSGGVLSNHISWKLTPLVHSTPRKYSTRLIFVFSSYNRKKKEERERERDIFGLRKNIITEHYMDDDKGF